MPDANVLSLDHPERHSVEAQVSLETASGMDRAFDGDGVSAPLWATMAGAILSRGRVADPREAASATCLCEGECNCDPETMVLRALDELNEVARPLFEAFGTGANTLRQDGLVQAFLELTGQPLPPRAGAGPELNAAVVLGGVVPCTEIGPGGGVACVNVACEGLCIPIIKVRWSDFRIWTVIECECFEWWEIVAMLALLMLLLGPAAARAALRVAQAAIAAAAAAAVVPPGEGGEVPPDQRPPPPGQNPT